MGKPRMQRKGVNPWSWSVKLGFARAQPVEGHRWELICRGQDAVHADGVARLATPELLVAPEATAMDSGTVAVGLGGGRSTSQEGES